MRSIVLAKVKRDDRTGNPTGLAVRKQVGCACQPLSKRAKRKRRGSKEYLAWLEDSVPALKKRLVKFLRSQADDIADQLWAELEDAAKVRKASASDVARIIASLDFTKWTALTGILEDELVQAFTDNANAAFTAIGFTPSEEIVELVNEKAVVWAARRSAELVGMKQDEDGNWVTNPNRKWAITESTRDSLRGLVEDAVDEGWSVDTLKAEILDAHAFSEARAETIARTELAFAHVEGNLEAWRDSGVVEMKQSILGSEHDLDDLCNDNADAGPIGLDEVFPSGHAGPPYHPNCVCDVIPVLSN